MQLQLTLAERQLLADILEQKRYALAYGTDPGQPVSVRDRVKADEYQELFGKVVEKRLQFSSDELDTLSALLSERARELKEQGESQSQNRQLLESVRDKIVELCVMF